MNDTQNNIEPIKEKLDDKIKKLNSSRVIKKVTPKGDLSWYVKWFSVALLLIATAARGVGTIPHIDMLGMGWISLARQSSIVLECYTGHTIDNGPDELLLRHLDPSKYQCDSQ